MPELIQKDCTVENLVERIVPILDNAKAVSAQRQAFAQIRRMLGGANPAQEVAGQVLSMINL